MLFRLYRPGRADSRDGQGRVPKKLVDVRLVEPTLPCLEETTGDQFGQVALRGGAELKPTLAATTVRVRNGKTVSTDGPFAETKEQLGGYYLIDVPDLDAAIAIARKVPLAKDGAIEIRPLLRGG